MPATPATEYGVPYHVSPQSDTQTALLCLRDVVKRLRDRDDTLSRRYGAGNISAIERVEYSSLQERLRAYRNACWYLEKERPL